jgi:hypothetical protein
VRNPSLPGTKKKTHTHTFGTKSISFKRVREKISRRWHVHVRMEKERKILMEEGGASCRRRKKKENIEKMKKKEEIRSLRP